MQPSAYMEIPRLSRRGARAIQTLDREGGAIGKEPRSAPYLLKLLTAPSAPQRNVAFLLVAQPPRLGKAGNVHLSDFLGKADSA